MIEEFRYRFKGKDAGNNRRVVIEKIEGGKVSAIKFIPKAEKLWRILSVKNGQKKP